MKIRYICFDMDGTVADLYAVPNWLAMLRAEDTTPYRVAKPMVDIPQLRVLLRMLQERGIENHILTWLSMGSSKDYEERTSATKIEWLSAHQWQFDGFHSMTYGMCKADVIRNWLAPGEVAILFDDSKAVRDSWDLGPAIDPAEVDIIQYLWGLLGKTPTPI